MKKVFVVGSPRSGTTLVQKLIGLREDFYSCKETHYFQLIRRSRRRNKLDYFGLRRANVRKAYEFIKQNNDLLGDYDYEEVKSLSAAAVQFDRILTAEAQARGKTGWIEKTPGHVFHISLIEKYIPSAQFVHVIRDGRDVVASTVDAARSFPDASAWKAYADLYVAIDRYNRCLMESTRYLDADGHVFVRYEHILDDVESTVDRLFDALGLDGGYRDLNLESTGIDETVTREDEGWKSDSVKKIKNTHLVKFNQIFSEEEKSHICTRAMTLSPETEMKLI